MKSSFPFLSLPISPRDFQKIVEMVKGANWLLSPFDEPDDNLFDRQRYIEASLDSGPRCAAIIDSNIFYRIVSLARGHKVNNEEESTESYRAIAAHMAFFQLCNILIEPNMPLYEGAVQKRTMS